MEKLTKIQKLAIKGSDLIIKPLNLIIKITYDHEENQKSNLP